MVPLVRRFIGVIGSAAVLAFAYLSISAASAVLHGQVVPEPPRRDVPVVLDGTVLAHAQVGDRIFVGGDFQEVQRPDGSIITQAHIFAYDIDTGLLDENFRPVLNNPVYDLQATAHEDALYASGRFWSWDDAFPGRIAKLAPDGTLDTSFQASAEAMVRSIAVTDDTVYMAGNFTTVNGATRIGFAAVDSTTGAVDPGFVMNVDDTSLTGQYGRGIVATSDGNAVFGLHFGTQINGSSRIALAKFDTSGATASLANWSIDWAGQAGDRLCLENLRAIAISPDDSYVVIGGQGADNPPNCDSVLRYETGGTGVMQYTWSARMYSSVFSLAVSDVAVYVGGHFCAAPANGAPAGGITHDPNITGTANRCNTGDPDDPVNPSVIFPTEAVFRNQIAALNPSNGQALAWDPGSNNDVAVFDITLIDRGLLAGHDGDRFNQFLVGRSGFFDFGVPDDTTPPSVTVDTPVDGQILSAVTAIDGTASDDRTVTSVTVQVKNITTGEWLQGNGSTLSATQANAPLTITPTDLGAADWSVDLGTTLPPGDYEVRVFATDQVGQTTNPPLVSTFRIAGSAACTVALDDNDLPVVSWSDFTNVSSVQIRRDNSWLASGAPDTGSFTDTGAAPGSYSYEVRWRPNGVVTDVACGSITVPEPVGSPCTAIINAAGQVELTWTAVPGEDSYQVRDDDGWVATVSNGGLSYTDTSPTLGDRTYVIRHRVAGVTTDRVCDPDPITVGGGGGGTPCTAVLDANGQVVLNWTAVPGVTNYQVRDDDGWVATVSNGGLAFTDFAPTSGDRTYVIRHRIDGVVTDRSCSPDPINVP